MKQLFRLFSPLLAATLSFSGLYAGAQGPTPRLAGALAGGSRATLAGSKSPHALAANDQGALPATTALKGITLVFKRSAAQETALQALLTAQQTPGSPQFHQWLTPEQFAEQFGIADSDISTVETWLQAQGFTLDRVARSRDRVTFSGTAAMVNSAFGAQLHRYVVGGVTHFAPSANLTVPAALAPLVTTVNNLSDFRPKPQVRLRSSHPELTSSQTQSHLLDPLDVATQYDVNSLYKAGYTGAGQSIAVVGESAIATTDIQNFLNSLSITGTPALQQVVVPNTGQEAIIENDEAESDIDLEYSSAMARSAQIYFVYVGDNINTSVFDALTYAVTEDVAPIISLSYGGCELEFSSSDVSGYTQLAEQANAQGQTIIAASGDSGSSNCYEDTNLNSAQQESLSTDFPADLAQVTGLGGLQMQAGTFAAGDTQYFAAASGSDAISSLLSYVPEVVWNEDSVQGTEPLAGGGGTSTLVPRPTWQTGVPGISSGTFRLVPDIALQASTGSPGYVFCSNDPSALGSDTASCSNGFRDSAGYYTAAGGTSFAAPIFAGMLAVLNQATNAPVGQGNINPTLYSLASNSTAYAAAFHDVTSGTIACPTGAAYCSAVGASAYSAGTGYDEATGLGSIDLAKLVAAWPATATGTTTALTATTTQIAYTSTNVTGNATTAGASVTASVTVTDASNVSPTGTVTVLLDGTTVAQSLALSAGTASFTFTAPTSTGTHVLTATYSGDAATATSRGTSVLTIGTLVPSGTFSLTATPVTLNYNSSGSGTVTVIPASGYGGVVNLTLSGTTTLTLCYATSDSTDQIYTDPSAAPFTTTLSIGEGTICSSTSSLARSGSGAWHLIKGSGTKAVSHNLPPQSPLEHWPAPVAFAGLLAGAWTLRRRGRSLPALLSLTLLAVAGFGLSGCGSSNVNRIGSTGSGTTTTSPQTITLTLTGTDSVSTGISSSTTFQLNLQ